MRSADASSVREACRHLRRGGILVFPTETSYGIGCDPGCDAAVAEIFRLKGRALRKPFPFIASSAAQITLVATFPAAVRKVAGRCWPGPLTVLLPTKAAFRSRALCGRRTIAIRVTGHPWARRLAAAFGRPVIATSANRSGQPPAFSLAASRRALGARGKDVLFVDGGRLPKRLPSTIIGWRNGNIIIHRHGAFSLRSR